MQITKIPSSGVDAVLQPQQMNVYLMQICGALLFTLRGGVQSMVFYKIVISSLLVTSSVSCAVHSF
jgi:hypothetical protein